MHIFYASRFPYKKKTFKRTVPFSSTFMSRTLVRVNRPWRSGEFGTDCWDQCHIASLHSTCTKLNCQKPSAKTGQRLIIKRLVGLHIILLNDNVRSPIVVHHENFVVVPYFFRDAFRSIRFIYLSVMIRTHFWIPRTGAIAAVNIASSFY